ncbi:RhuM family protein [Pedobacter changchengzhani]|uniref:RhuM family protein n=1 Tax=Pedobacter changchengzhani TaxID=2529274 RepID=UPI001A9DC9AD|nr:RhuM family protein [Pedobacter changchengzhani]
MAKPKNDGELYQVETHTINYHLKKIFSDSELEETAVVRNFRITAQDGKTYNTNHYNLSAIIAVGYKVNSERAIQSRKWATQVLQDFTIKGFAKPHSVCLSKHSQSLLA